MLRIIGGAYKGRKLLAPPGLDTRPLPDRIKQSIFDWLGQSCNDLRVIDICAGSGSFGLEAYSRNAREVHLVESGRHAISIIQGNIRTLGSPASVHLHARPFQSVLPTLRHCDLIFADPPFPWFQHDVAQLSTLLTLAAECLSLTGRLIIRGERGTDLPSLPRTLREHDRRFYGRSWVALLQIRSMPPEPQSLLPK